ncbi:TPA: hypothetical protein N0F65_001457 [Lagenidium giganteum]|uniref:Uncharacterized protein n=1 Tax=Lagenidium giganteum TaxID=4803 RepID=A0AAV2YKH5_9STRA|nr:TPA: hypothetical protein N0F65_001457 [Lagenidium giganteum]
MASPPLEESGAEIPCRGCTRRKSGNEKSANDDFERLTSNHTTYLHPNTKKAMKDRMLITLQWLAIGRSSDIGRIRYDDLQWMGNFMLVRLAAAISCRVQR